MRRRDFLRAAGGGAAATAAVGTAEAGMTDGEVVRQTDGNETTTTGNESTTTSGGSLPGAGTTETVIVGPGGDYVYEPETLYVQPGTTVNFVWESDFHNIVVDAQPEDGSWPGTPGGAQETYDTGYEYEFQFTTLGTYEYFCQPHVAQGMEASVVVNESGEAPGGGGGGGGGEEELNPEEMGVPFQAHYVGLATIVGIIVTIVYNFFALKYGESDHASAPNKD